MRNNYFKFIIAVLLIIIIAFGAASCSTPKVSKILSSSEDSEVARDITIAQKASIGNLPEANFQLGTSLAAIKEANPNFLTLDSDLNVLETSSTISVSGASSVAAVSNLNVSICPNWKNKDVTVILTNSADDSSNVNYYYNNKDAAKGISRIVTFAHAFGLIPNGDLKQDLIKRLGTPAKQGAPTAAESNFFAIAPKDYTMITYNYSKYRVNLFFDNNDFLQATVYEDTTLWKD